MQEPTSLCLLAAGLLLAPVAAANPAQTEAKRVEPLHLGPGARAWREAEQRAIRGLTVGPIESVFHPERGYGSEVCDLAMRDASAFGANWVSITPFGRVFDLQPSGVAMSYEAPYRQNREAVSKAIRQAHAAGLRVMLVPHLWVETGQWRGLIDPGSEDEWSAWADAYAAFVAQWARVAAETHVEMLVVGVELRRWVTGEYAPLFTRVIERVRHIFPGLLTYAANWDDVHDTVIWGDVDLIGVNAFFPLAQGKNAELSELVASSNRIAGELEELSSRWQRPVVFTEFGYTTRTDPALEPWLWPEHLVGVAPDEQAQANAYRALLSAFISKPWFVGGFAWRVFSDPYDLSQEPEWGFSPQGKLAELVLQDAFHAQWASDGVRPVGSSLGLWSASEPHLVGVEP